METQYSTLREKIAAESTQRRERNATFENYWRDANLEAHMAVQHLEVRPMSVTDGTRVYHVADGVCGFAYITVRPATSAFARWLKAKGFGHKAYHGGWEVSVPQYGQCMQRKELHASVVAEYFTARGIAVGSYSRMD
jgi:hypothetical protein